MSLPVFLVSEKIVLIARIGFKIGFPAKTRMIGIYSSTLYGSLCLISLLNTHKIHASGSYELILTWIEASFGWTLEKHVLLSTREIRVETDEMYTERHCTRDLLDKFFELFESNEVLLNDFIARMALKTRFCMKWFKFLTRTIH